MILVGLVLAASIGPVAFKAPGGFVITSRVGEVLEHVSTIGGKIPENLTVSPDGMTWVFTAYDAAAQQPLLYRATRGEKPVLLGRPAGYHAQPRFTNDGKWVYFIHHPNPNAGAAGSHGSGMYGQVWRIRPVGSDLEQVTFSEGCKTSPDPESEARIYMAHADCNKSSAIESVSAKKPIVISPLSTFRTILPRVSPNGKQLAFVRLANDSFSLVLVNGKREAVIRTWQTPQEPSALEWGAERDTLLVQTGPRIELVSTAGETRDLLNLTEVLP